MDNLKVDYSSFENAVHYDFDGDYLPLWNSLFSIGHKKVVTSNQIIPEDFNKSIDKKVDYENCVLDILLKDRSTNRNIIWATNDYSHLKLDYKAECEIVISSMAGLIQSRTAKEQSAQTHRIRDKAEVFTPSWICNEQNNLIDNQWFGQKDVFNTQLFKSWETNPQKVPFSNGKTWKDYVDARRLEITCGEAPYLVSRYDSVTGEIIDIKNRIGILDRKMRVVNENTDVFEDWWNWTQRAYQSTYGYEYQGDNLLIARKNLLYTFVDNLKHKFYREPDISELKKIATIISWNIWQMDGITCTVPLSGPNDLVVQLSLFEPIKVNEGKSCKIKDWRSKVIVEYATLLRGQ